ncbi:MAG: peptide chain release factor N(5)-glutamine methyltransferase [Planctomycetaceae bacterium]|nr:peptide chain release factor N(5)-glutamine methyltransferase [Planctomycetaceae bacterium]
MATEETAADSTASGEWTVRKVLDWSIDHFKKNGSDSPRLDAEVLLAHARGCQRIQLYTQYDQPLTDQQRAVMRDLVKRRVNAEPVAYLVGHREFFSLDFVVNRDVFIPRPDTETLVMSALDAARELPQPKILDLCTGSGCVAIAIAVNARKSQVTAVELHPATAKVTRQNIERHGMESRVSLLEGNLFEPLPKGARFDLIVSNPPYVTTGEMAGLDPDVRHEPTRALDGGTDGLDIIRLLIQQAPNHLHDGGWLMLELSPEQAPETMNLFTQRGFQQVGAVNDLSGQARVVQGRWTE